MVMMAMMPLEGGERLLGGGEIAGLERLAERVQRTAAGRGRGRLARRKILLEGGEGLLGGRKIAGLQGVAERLEVGLNLSGLSLPRSRRKSAG